MPKYAIALLLIVVAAGPASAQEADLQKCAVLNVANFLVKCATLMSTIQQVSKGHVVDKSPKDVTLRYLEIANNLYKVAGRKLTKEAIIQRSKQDAEEINAAMEEFVDRVKRRALGKSLKDNPDHLLYQCGAKRLGAELRDAAKLQVRLEAAAHEAQDLLKKQSSCLK